MKRHCFFLVFLLLSLWGFSQNNNDNRNTSTQRVSDIFTYDAPTSNYLLLNQVESNPNNQQVGTTIDNSRNVTVIQQVGNQNRAISNSFSETSDINFLQIGANNTIESTNLIPNTTERFVQTGNNNVINSFSFGNVEASSLQILQNGNDQRFEKFGTNSLTDRISLSVTGNNQTVIIRSF